MGEAEARAMEAERGKPMPSSSPTKRLDSRQAATLRRHLINHAKGAGADADLIASGLDALQTKYDTASDVIALERLFHELEEIGMDEMHRQRAASRSEGAPSCL